MSAPSLCWRLTCRVSAEHLSSTCQFRFAVVVNSYPATLSPLFLPCRRGRLSLLDLAEQSKSCRPEAKCVPIHHHDHNNSWQYIFRRCSGHLPMAQYIYLCPYMPSADFCLPTVRPELELLIVSLRRDDTSLFTNLIFRIRDCE